MKILKAFLLAAIMMVATLGSCQKENASSLDSTKISSMSAEKKIPHSKLNTVDLGLAGNFAILSKSGITNVYPSSVTGDIGTSPITGAAIGLTCVEVVGAIYSVNAAGPLPCVVTNASRLTTAVLNMQTAYNDAAGRQTPNFVNYGAGNLGGKTLVAGLYKFTSDVIIPTNMTISGSSTDVWILQISGTLNMSSNMHITLTGGAQAKHIYWQTAGAVTLGTTSHFEGIILSKTAINMQTGASINGRMYAQTAVTLQMNTVVAPN